MLSKIKFSDSAKAYSGKHNQSKSFTFEPSIEYQSFKLTAELHLTRKKNLVILKNLNIKDSFYSLLDSQICQNPQQIFLFLDFIKKFQSFNSCMIRFGIIFPEICFENFIYFELSSQFYVKIKNLDYLHRNQQFFCPK